MENTNNGRPEYSDNQFEAWLEEMKSFLKLGNTLNYSIDKAGLSKHRTTLYEKYKLNDWFSDKINRFRSYLGEIVNDIFAREILTIEEIQKQGRPISDEQWRNLRFFAEHHKSCASFFEENISKNQSANKEDIEALLNKIEKTNYEELGLQAKKQLVGNTPT